MHDIAADALSLSRQREFDVCRRVVLHTPDYRISVRPVKYSRERRRQCPAVPVIEHPACHRPALKPETLCGVCGIGREQAYTLGRPVIKAVLQPEVVESQPVAESVRQLHCHHLHIHSPAVDGHSFHALCPGTFGNVLVGYIREYVLGETQLREQRAGLGFAARLGLAPVHGVLAEEQVSAEHERKRQRRNTRAQHRVRYKPRRGLYDVTGFVQLARELVKAAYNEAEKHKHEYGEYDTQHGSNHRQGKHKRLPYNQGCRRPRMYRYPRPLLDFAYTAPEQQGVEQRQGCVRQSNCVPQLCDFGSVCKHRRVHNQHKNAQQLLQRRDNIAGHEAGVCAPEPPETQQHQQYADRRQYEVQTAEIEGHTAQPQPPRDEAHRVLPRRYASGHLVRRLRRQGRSYELVKLFVVHAPPPQVVYPIIHAFLP